MSNNIPSECVEYLQGPKTAVPKKKQDKTRLQCSSTAIGIAGYHISLSVVPRNPSAFTKKLLEDVEVEVEVEAGGGGGGGGSFAT